MEKLFYGLSAEQKAEANEALTDQKYDGSLGDFIIQFIRQNVISAQRHILAKKWTNPSVPGMEIPISQEEYDKIEVKHDPKFEFAGETGAVVITSKMYEAAIQWYKLQKYIDKQFGIMTSKYSCFEEFVDQKISEQMNALSMGIFEKELDEEKIELEKTEAAKKAESEKLANNRPAKPVKVTA